jgi:hypothetical protein
MVPALSGSLYNDSNSVKFGDDSSRFREVIQSKLAVAIGQR